jgi:hypothetical protein
MTKETDKLDLPKRASLASLYVRGKNYTLEDAATGTKVEVYLQKMNPVEHKQASRMANAVRSAVLSAQQDKNSDDYIDLYTSVSGFSQEELVEQLLTDERMKIFPVKLEEMRLDDPWKDGYLDGLQDSWNSGLEDIYTKNPHDEEAARVRKQLFEFRDAMNAAVDVEIDAKRNQLVHMLPSELIDSVMRLTFRLLGDQAWLDEFTMCEVLFAVRDPDTHEQIFSTREEVNVLQKETILELSRALRELTVDPVEGKGSAAMPPF